MDIYAIYLGGLAVDIIETTSAKKALEEFFEKQNFTNQPERQKGYWAESIYA